MSLRQRSLTTTPAWAVVLIVLTSTACGGGPGQDAASRSTARNASTSEERIVNVYNWFDYIDPAMLEKFTATTGIKVVYDTYDANEMLETKLLTANTGYDVVVPSLTFLERHIRAGVF